MSAPDRIFLSPPDVGPAERALLLRCASVVLEPARPVIDFAPVRLPLGGGELSR